IIKKIERARVKMEQIKPRSTLPRGKKEGGLTVKLFKGHYTSLCQRHCGCRSGGAGRETQRQAATHRRSQRKT
ncbi:MAG: hypothetical protein ACREYE_18900, partial [Gammaproteobacteria bacterium]